MLARIRKSMEEKDQGFTLIELLVVVIIIGILAAIAIPTFLNQRKKAWEKAAVSDARNAAVVLEEVFSDTGKYVVTAAADSDKFKLSNDVTLKIKGDAGGYCIVASHANLTDTQVLDSANGKVTKNGTCTSAGSATEATFTSTPAPAPSATT